jgi:hypothetical protein
MADNTNTARQRNRFEVYNTIILAIATLSITWCSYQSSLWNGIQTFRLAESNKFNRLAQQQIIQAGQEKAMEESLIISFINAAYEKDQKMIDYILKGVRPELSKIMSDWLQANPFENLSAPRHPMVMPAYQELMDRRIGESKKMSEKAGEMFETAQRANTISDRYILLTVIFSMVMFLGAIATKLTRLQLGYTLVIISGLICIGCLIFLLFNMSTAHK